MIEQEEEYVWQSDIARELLPAFGLRLIAYGPGVLAMPQENPDAREPIAFSRPAWEWLSPLLIELRERRKGDNKK